MVNELMMLTDGFTGPAAHTQCFLHIINLVAKSFLRQFDVKKKDIPNNSTISDSPDMDAMGNSEKEGYIDSSTVLGGNIVHDQQALEDLMIKVEGENLHIYHR